MTIQAPRAPTHSRRRFACRIPSQGTLRIAALAIAALWLGCAGPEAGVDDPELGEAERHAQRRQAIVDYLEATQPLDTSNTFQARDSAAEQGPALVPALVEMLNEESSATNAYHLVRLGCSLIVDGHVDETQAGELHREMAATLGRFRGNAEPVRLMRVQLRNCQPPSTPTASPSG